MKKVLSIVVGVILAVVLLVAGTAYWFGSQAEKQYHAMLQEAAKAGYLKLENIEYDRGVFSARARTLVEFPVPAGNFQIGTAAPETESASLTLVHDIQHGIFPFGKNLDGEWCLKPMLVFVETRVLPGPDSKGGLPGVLGDIPELSAIRTATVFYFSGQGESIMEIPSFRCVINKEKHMAVIWQGLTATMTFSEDLRKFEGALNAPALEVVGDDGDFKMIDLRSDFDFDKGKGKLVLGDSTFNIGQIQFAALKNGKRDKFSVHGLKMKSASELAGENINYSFSTNIDRIRYSGSSHGPGVFEMEFRNLDAGALAELQEAFEGMQSQFAGASGEEAGQMVLATYAQFLPALLEKSPEMEIKSLSMQTSEGNFSGYAKVTFDGSRGAPLGNPLMLLNSVSAQAEFTATDVLFKKMVRTSMEGEFNKARKAGQLPGLTDEQISVLITDQVAQQLDALVEQKYLVSENGEYKAKASYQQGTVNLNGNAIPLPVAGN